MDLQGEPSTSLVKCCDCDCICNSSMNRNLSGTWLRSVKRKVDENGEGGENFLVPGFDIPQVARVEISNERDALREMVTNQQETIQELSLELEEERNASSSAANEAMSMILRLQREKAEIQMEFRQFKRFADEKMAHDQQELSAMEDLLYKREEAMQALYCEMQAYKHRMMSYGLSEVEVDGEGEEKGTMSRNNSAISGYDYPPLKCNLYENQEQMEGEDYVCDDVEKYVFGETPRSRDHLKDLEFRINQLERNKRPPCSPKNVLEKVIVGHSPRHTRRFSSDNAYSPIGSPTLGKKENLQMNYSKLRNIDTGLEDNMSDRVYTIDSVHKDNNKPGFEGLDDYLTTPREKLAQMDLGDADIQKLYMRLQALEVDRESMRKTIISMRTDKAQLVLLKEIAQHLCKEMTPAKKMPVKKQSPVGNSSSTSVFKLIWSFVFWKKKSRRSKYLFGGSLHKAGLLMLLDKGPRVGQWRCLSKTQKL